MTIFSPCMALVSALILLLLSGCGIRHDTPQGYLAQRSVPAPFGGLVTVCSGFGCARREPVQLSSIQVAQLNALFTPKAQSAHQERERLARAVALFEQIAGKQAGTANDFAKNRRDSAATGQLDCVAETINTTVALLLFEEMGLMSYHRTAPPEHRGSTVFTAHNTAVIQDEHGQEYAVDSWFHANGELPEIVPLPAWKSGFVPSERIVGKQPISREP